MRLSSLYGPLILLLALTGCQNETPQVLDHFKCYVAEGEVPEHQALTLKDQFNLTEGVHLTALRYFCNPVTKTINGEPHEATPDEDHLTCYQIEPDERFTANVGARNQFGETELITDASELLCVPSHKHGFEELADTSDHCPGGENCCCNMPDGAGGTWPDCDAGLECRRQVNATNPNDAIQVCVPVGTPANDPLALHPSQPAFCRR